uniref:Uncharacterized protein n=1 Tax=Cannabis sativa TaxID=3483 RepID=A0A803NK92_CANSA
MWHPCRLGRYRALLQYLARGGTTDNTPVLLGLENKTLVGLPDHCLRQETKARIRNLAKGPSGPPPANQHVVMDPPLRSTPPPHRSSGKAAQRHSQVTCLSKGDRAIEVLLMLSHAHARAKGSTTAFKKKLEGKEVELKANEDALTKVHVDLDSTLTRLGNVQHQLKKELEKECKEKYATLDEQQAIKDKYLDLSTERGRELYKSRLLVKQVSQGVKVLASQTLETPTGQPMGTLAGQPVETLTGQPLGEVPPGQPVGGQSVEPSSEAPTFPADVAA